MDSYKYAGELLSNMNQMFFQQMVNRALHGIPFQKLQIFGEV
jgi:molybdenum-dependent DNA-binding transcriptional regulator ModE